MILASGWSHAEPATRSGCGWKSGRQRRGSKQRRDAGAAAGGGAAVEAAVQVGGAARSLEKVLVLLLKSAV